MYTEDELNAAMFKVIEQNKVPYTQEGLDFLLEETKKLLPKREVVFTIESLEDLSVQNREERKAPKITVSYQ
jgi:hypothetical protein